MLIRHFYRRNLPHLYYNEGIYFITYRLYGSIPESELKIFKDLPEVRSILQYNHYKSYLKKYDSLLHNPSNPVKYLIEPGVMEICKSSIHYYDGSVYNIICYCIMPNHIHLVFELLSDTQQVGEIMGSIKKYSAKESNRVLKRTGTFWQAESFDRLVRDDVELYFIIKYVLLNPVYAGLTEDWKSWEGTFCRPEFQVID
jgi:putative transposase